MLEIKRLDYYWYHKNPLAYLLLPLSWVFQFVVNLRRKAYQLGIFAVHTLDTPVIVVGNICVGGSGKTPLIIWLAEYLKAKGYKPGIISRGYGATDAGAPQHVGPTSDPRRLGDEPVLLAQRSGCPVVIDANRPRAARTVARGCDIILSDDGLQHYALGRTIEIAVVDDVRRFGNGFCLPAGPLRESLTRLQTVDLIVRNRGTTIDNDSKSPLVDGSEALLPASYDMHFIVVGIMNLQYEDICLQAADCLNKTVHAVAGIGFPERLFNQLRDLGMKVIEHAFPDHHDFTAADLDFGDNRPIIMTEKDAVKCRRFAQAHHWYVSIKASLDESFAQHIISLVERNKHG